MNDIVQLEMTLDEARETDRLIKRHINTTRYLLLDMRDRKGWKVLGYESFKDYGEKELGYHENYIYKLVNAAEISLQIGFDPDCTIVQSPPETHLRPLKTVPEAVRKAIWDEATRKAEEEGAKLTAQRVAEGVAEWKQRSQELQQESNERRKKVRELEQQLDLLKAQPPAEKVVEKPVIPPEFASLEEAIAAKKKSLDRLNQDTQTALQHNSKVHKCRDRLEQEVEGLTLLLSKHKAAQREMVEHKRLTDTALHFTATFLAEVQALEHVPDPVQARRWQQVCSQLRDTASALQHFMDRLEPTPLVGELLEAA